MFVALPLTIALTTYVFGTLLPVIGYETTHREAFQPHSIIWESLYGIGFCGAAWVCYFFNLDYGLNRPVGLVGGLIWPLLIMTIVFIGSRRILRRSPHTRLFWGIAFLLSLLICVVGQKAENYLADRCYLPLYWNYEASNF